MLICQGGLTRAIRYFTAGPGEDAAADVYPVPRTRRRRCSMSSPSEPTFRSRSMDSLSLTRVALVAFVVLFALAAGVVRRLQFRRSTLTGWSSRSDSNRHCGGRYERDRREPAARDAA